MKLEGKQKEDFPEFISGLPIGEIIRSIRSIHFGHIQIIVQDSKVIQIDKTEKKRIIPRIDADYSL